MFGLVNLWPTFPKEKRNFFVNSSPGTMYKQSKTKGTNYEDVSHTFCHFTLAKPNSHFVKTHRFKTID